jgi:hypothetical protein
MRSESTFAMRIHLYPDTVTATLDSSLLTDRLREDSDGPERTALGWRVRYMMQFAF